jgi:molybdopterin converting factor subunit 1
MTAMSGNRDSVRILYFAWLRERVGTGEECLAPPAGIATVGSLIAWLAERDAAHALAFANRGVIRCAVNQVFAGPDSPVKAGDEVAFFPPVTGG